MFAKYIFLTFFTRKKRVLKKTDELYLRTSSSNESGVNYYLAVPRLHIYSYSVTSLYPPDSWDYVIRSNQLSYAAS